MAKRTQISASEFNRYTSLCEKYHPILVLCHLALITVISWWHLVISELPLTHPFILLFAVLTPLSLSLIACLTSSYKGAIGICFISLFYFTSGVTHWFHPVIWPIGVSETLLSANLFCLGLLYARWKGLSELPVSHQD